MMLTITIDENAILMVNDLLKKLPLENEDHRYLTEFLLRTDNNEFTFIPLGPMGDDAGSVFLKRLQMAGEKGLVLSIIDKLLLGNDKEYFTIIEKTASLLAKEKGFEKLAPIFREMVAEKCGAALKHYDVLMNSKIFEPDNILDTKFDEEDVCNPWFCKSLVYRQLFFASASHAKLEAATSYLCKMIENHAEAMKIGSNLNLTLLDDGLALFNLRKILRVHIGLCSEAYVKSQYKLAFDCYDNLLASLLTKLPIETQKNLNVLVSTYFFRKALALYSLAVSENDRVKNSKLIIEWYKRAIEGYERAINERGNENSEIQSDEHAGNVLNAEGDVYYNLAIAYSLNKELEHKNLAEIIDHLRKAIDCYKKALSINKELEHKNLAEIIDYLRKAIDCYKKALSINVNNNNSLVEHETQAEQVERDLSVFLIEYAIECRENENYQQVIDCSKEAQKLILKLHLENKEKKAFFNSYYYQGIAFLELGKKNKNLVQLKDAIINFTEALKHTESSEYKTIINIKISSAKKHECNILKSHQNIPATNLSSSTNALSKPNNPITSGLQNFGVILNINSNSTEQQVTKNEQPLNKIIQKK